MRKVGRGREEEERKIDRSLERSERENRRLAREWKDRERNEGGESKQFVTFP